MQKTGLKTFVCSFILSLFMIFTINGIFWRATPSKTSDLKIPTKNIMLFINSNQTNPSVRSVPVKKVALSVLEKAIKGDVEKPQQIAYQQPVEEKIIMADAKMFELPLEIAPSAENIEIPLQKMANSNNLPPTKSEEALAKQVMPVQKIVHKDVEIPLTRAEIKKSTIQDNVVVRFAENEQKENKVEHLLPKPAAKVASNAPPKMLFPLQHGVDDSLNKNTDVKVINSAEPNQVALTDANIPIKSMINEQNSANSKAPPKKKDSTWKDMAQKQPKKLVEDSPWTVAKSKSKPQNNLLLKENYYNKDAEELKEALKQPEAAHNENEIDIASETIKNLLIPIPEDILNDENLTPQLVSSKKPDEIKKEVEVEQKLQEKESENEKNSKIVESSKIAERKTDFKMNKIEEPAAKKELNITPNVPSDEDNKKSLLTSLSSIFTSSSNVNGAKDYEKGKSDGIIDSFKKKIKAKKSRGKIMPTEMRLSFQPNRAEISGQTLRWIQAFATKAAEDEKVMIEIRIDGTSAMELQQKRLNLLHNILTNSNVEYSKINTVFTNREPNSFIIRTVITNNSSTENVSGSFNQGAKYYKQW